MYLLEILTTISALVAERLAHWTPDIYTVSSTLVTTKYFLIRFQCSLYILSKLLARIVHASRDFCVFRTFVIIYMVNTAQEPTQMF